MNGASDTPGRIDTADAAEAAHSAATSGSHTTNRRRFAKALYSLFAAAETELGLIVHAFQEKPYPPSEGA